MSSFKQYSFQPCEPKKPKPTNKIFKVHDGTGIKKVTDNTKHALARARWGTFWYKENKKDRIKAQADFRTQNDESSVFGGTDGETNYPERNIYRVVITQTEEEELQYFEELLDSSKLLDEKVQLPTNDAEKLMRDSNPTAEPDYWTPRLRRNVSGMEGVVDELEIVSQWSDRDGTTLIVTSDNFQGLTDPNDVINQLFADFRTGFGPHVEENWGSEMSFDIDNNIFMIEVKLFNQLSSSSRQKLCGPIGKNSLSFPNIWIYSTW